MIDTIKAARTRIGMAEEQLQIACKEMRQNGMPESADELAIELKRLRIWTQKDGFLDHLAKPAPEPTRPVNVTGGA